MCKNNLLTIEQYGFRRGHSTELAAIQLVDCLTKQMDLGNVSIYIYINLSKAFDTLDHTILLDKLNYYGIMYCMKFLCSKLTSRYIFVFFIRSGGFSV